MDIAKPLYWHQGMFLQPQHFQMEDLYVQSLLAPFHRFQQPHFWGVGSMEIQEAALGSGTLGLHSGEFLFPDGTYVIFPGNAVLSARSFTESWEGGEEPFTVYLGLRKWNPTGKNVTEVARLEDPGDISTRFITTVDPEESQDLYAAGPPAQLRRLHYHLRLIWESEREEMREYDMIPLAQLRQDGKEVQLADSFIPPSLSLAASDRLNKLVREIRDQITTRCRQLEEIKTTRNVKTADLEIGDFVQLLGLRILGRYVPALHHCTEAHDVHPWQVYGMLRELVGELSTFSDRLTANGELTDGSRVLPLYDHRNLHGCFSTIQVVVNHLLDEIMLGEENTIHLRPENGVWVGDMPASAFDPRFQYCLVMRTERPEDWVVDSVMTVAKLSSRENIAALTTRFVGGVPLEHLPYPPPGVPRLAHAVYFRIDRDNPQWAEVQESGGVAMYWDMAPEDLQAEIVIQR